jgi:molybdopterin biosynthesis enzyme MoaB
MCVMPTEGIFAKVITGGKVKQGDEIMLIPAIQVAIITISDKGFSGVREDRSGPALVEALKEHAVVGKTLILPDEKDKIAETLIRLRTRVEWM